ncbi:Signal transduction histidine kinase CheA, partial [hydrothermal vent metagenome]
MSNIEQIDFSTLIWVKQELDETLKRAQDALEEYVENPEDENQLQFCATYLHQVQGTLKMVELYGAAMVAEEMEQVVKKIIAKEVDSEKDSFEVLMRGIILLPDYLERIQLGYKDIPMVLLPLVNDLRTVKGDQLLSESALFNPDLSLGMPESKFSSSFTLSPNQLNQVVHKIRSAYQVCFLNWLKDIDVEANLKKIQIIVDKLKTVITPIDEKQLFWVAGGLFEALISGGLEKSVTVKQLAARLDQAIRMLTTPDTTEDRCYKKLTNNLLYYVALADSKDRRVKEIQTFFRLSDFISDDKEIEHAQSSLSGKNRELLESVTNVIKEDLMTIQESLDLYNRNEHGSVADLESFVSSFSKISDTLGIIGIGVARSKIRKDIELLEENIKNDTVLDADTIMHVAETLLFVESALDENILLLGAIKDKFPAEESLIPAAEMKTIMDTLAKESIQNLQRIKQNFVQYMEAPWNKESIKLSPKLLREISGALKMSGYEDVAIEIDKIEQYTSKYMLESDHKPTVDQLDLLAESIASLEYYLEYLSDGIKGEERILDLARSNITLLFETVEKTEKQRQHTQNLDSNLDQMSDDDFDMSDLDDGLSESDSDAGIGYDELLEDSDNIDDLDVEKEEAELIVAFSNDTDDDIKEVFLEEFEEELEHLNSIFPIWKDDFDTQVELLGEIRRIYHTFKGSGRLVGAFAIGDYSWRIEEMINPVLNETHTVNESFLQVMQRSTDILPGLLDALKNETVVPPGYHAVIAAAEKVANGETLQDGIFIETKTEVEAEAEETGELQSDIPAADEDTIHPDNQSDTDESQISVADTDLDTVTTDVEQTDTDDLSVDPVFVEILQQEVEGHLSEITEFLQNIKETGNHNSTEQFIRVIHTLNGAANMASVNSIVEMTAPLELAAKLSHELNIDLDTESVDKISQFREQAFNIMKDLSNNSESSLLTAGIGAYFKGLFEKLDAEKSAAKLIYSEEGSGMDFDLSQFIDEADSSENTGSDIDTTEETELTEYTIDDINVEEDKIIKDESIEYSESADKTDLS